MQKEKRKRTSTYTLYHMKNNSEWFIDLNIRANVIKLEKKIEILGIVD